MSDDHENHENLVLLNLGRLEGKMDALLQSINRHDQDLEMLSRSVQDLERSRAKFIGICLATSTAASYIFHKLPFP